MSEFTKNKKILADVVLACGEPMPDADVWIVIDILRATTVICRWFELGGEKIYPVLEPEDAENLAAELIKSGEKPLLMGERHAVLIDGFDLGNSPLALSRELINKNPCAVMSTTNGTAALLAAFDTGKPVIAACMRNVTASLKYAISFFNPDNKNKNLNAEDNDFKIGILCSGRRRRPAWDDTLCAGLFLNILKDICAENNYNLIMADCARIAFNIWRDNKDNFLKSVMTAGHAIFLDNLGFGPDIKFACEQDAASVVPMLYYNNSVCRENVNLKNGIFLKNITEEVF